MGKEEKKSRSGGEERERERERDRDRERDRERDRDRHKDKVRSSRDHRDRDRDRERDRDSRSHREHHREHRDRHRDRDRDRDRERERDREHRDRKREREKREKSRDVDEEREGKRSRREDDRAGSVDRRAGSVDRRATSVEVDEEDIEAKKAAEQKRLDEEIEKRRRRVQEWQELRRKKEEEERQSQGEQAEANGKTWTLEGDDSDEEGDNRGENGDVPMAEADEKPSGNGKEVTMSEGAETAQTVDQEEEIDPLDAFMNTMVIPEVQKLEAAPVETGAPSKPTEKTMKKIRRPGGESDSDVDVVDDGEEENEEDDEEFLKRVKKTKAEKLAVVDHAKMQYAPFRKNFYKEVGEIQKMTDEDVAAYRKELELKVRGKDLPKPVKTWNQTGLKSKVLDVIKKLGFEKPMPIQAQALPIIMSGRDCIGIAKTGSGKTLAFVLPMLRHIKDQPPLAQGDGPIGLIMAPTRELVQQIYSDIKKFTRVIGLTCIPVYGGSGVAQQISELKRGAEIVVCTPGRMIDILCTSSGKITNLRRVTYLVMDEADRMFDLGFEPQITRIVQNTRPDRQTVLFSATFPKQVELLARKVLDKPVEIQVGGRSVVNKDITQTVEVRPEEERFLRLLELLGEWYEKGKVLVFVHTQDKCDSLFRDLLKAGYPCLSLHGAKDQTDRESTLSDFKSNVCNLMVATSVAARGLDVKELELVVNYDVPNHYEDYVHRVGRTGRAGRKGHAVTFIAPDEDRYAPDLVKALELSEQPIPEDLKALADAFTAKVNQGSELKHGSGYGGSGFKFNEEEDEAMRAAKKAQAKEYGYEEEDEKTDEDEEGETGRKSTGDVAAQAMLAFKAAQSFAAAAAAAAGVTAALPAVPAVPGILPGQPEATAKALTFAKNLQQNYQKITAMGQPFEAELEINDYPQHARWKVTHKDALGQISDWTGAAITTRGQFFAPGKVPGPGERKLYLFIEGPSENSVKKAKAEIRRILEESTSNNLQPAVQPGKYSVL